MQSMVFLVGLPEAGFRPNLTRFHPCPKQLLAMLDLDRLRTAGFLPGVRE
jgi:hypothetical protein